MFAGGNNAKRMYKDATPVGQVMRNADRRNKVKDQKREREELMISQRDARKARIKAYEAQNTGLNIPT